MFSVGIIDVNPEKQSALVIGGKTYAKKFACANLGKSLLSFD